MILLQKHETNISLDFMEHSLRLHLSILPDTTSLQNLYRMSNLTFPPFHQQKEKPDSIVFACTVRYSYDAARNNKKEL